MLYHLLLVLSLAYLPLAYADSDMPKSSVGVCATYVHRVNEDISKAMDVLSTGDFALSPFSYHYAHGVMVCGKMALENQYSLGFKLQGNMGWEEQQKSHILSTGVDIRLPGVKDDFWTSKKIVDPTKTGYLLSGSLCGINAFGNGESNGLVYMVSCGLHGFRYDDALHLDIYADGSRTAADPKTLDVKCTNLPIGIEVGIECGTYLDNKGADMASLCVLVAGNGGLYANYATKLTKAFNATDADTTDQTTSSVLISYSATITPKIAFNVAPYYLSVGAEVFHAGLLCAALNQLANDTPLDTLDNSGMLTLVSGVADIGMIF